MKLQAHNNKQLDNAHNWKMFGANIEKFCKTQHKLVPQPYFPIKKFAFVQY